VFHGEWEEGTWNAQPWREGSSLYELWKPHRFEDTPPTPDLKQARACAMALSLLHAEGWVHGDVQPAHFIIGAAVHAHLIDLALAQGGAVPEAYDFRYRGCLVHYEAPEISSSVLETGTAVPSPASDVYALGASLFISVTGWRHVDYPDDAPRAVQRKAIVNKPHRPVNVPGPLGELIRAMMRRSPSERPTIAQVTDALGEAA
jgi:serine/threonine protein kinase